MSAFRATFSDVKLVKTRGMAQFIFELPIEEFDAAYKILGGVPVPGKERWVGIAVIKSPQQEEVPSKAAHQSSPPTPPTDGQPERGKIGWRDMQPGAQAALHCKDARFRAFLMEEYDFRPRVDEDQEEQAANFLRDYFGIKSRSELGTDPRRRMLWKQMDDQFRGWLALENAS